MATKTITIDLEAYKRLKAVQRDTESFSQTIKRTVQAPLDLAVYREQLAAFPMSPKAADAVEEHVRNRHAPSRKKR